MSAERNTAREWRRALARRNALANEIAAACASGRVPDRRLVAEWSLASMRVYAREKHLRPRECGTPLGEGNNQAAPLRRESRPVDRDAGRGPESGTSSPRKEPEPMNEIPNPIPCDGCPVRYKCHKADADCLMPERWEEASDE